VTGEDSTARPTIPADGDPFLAAASEARRPCVCMGGSVWIGHVDEDGEEHFERYPCKRCYERRRDA
jgi:hypothetical protein